MKIKISVTLNDDQIRAIMKEADLNDAQEVAAFLKGYYISESPELADLFGVEVIEESEDDSNEEADE